jgi:hypothetical protein
MGWFRWQRRIGAWLALLALVLQLGLTFAHVHHQAPGYPTAIAAQPAAGTDGDQGDADKDYCASCAILNLLAGAQAGVAPTPPLPGWAQVDTTRPAFETVRSTQIRTAFQSRAPPLS